MSQHATLKVVLIDSKNTTIDYPAHGLLEITEVGIDHHIVAAVFRKASLAGYGAPVRVRFPVFEYHHPCRDQVPRS